MGFEVNIRKPSPEFDGAEECPCFQQTRFWAEFKAAHGWKMQDKKTLKKINRLLADIERNDNDGLGQPELLKGNLAAY